MPLKRNTDFMFYTESFEGHIFGLRCFVLYTVKYFRPPATTAILIFHVTHRYIFHRHGSFCLYNISKIHIRFKENCTYVRTD